MPAPAAAHGELIYIDAATKDAYVRGERVRLTPAEFALLALLHARRGSLVTYGEICRRVWGWDYTPHVLTNVHNLVSRLRRKVEVDARRPTLIQSKEGGYCLQVVAPATPPLLKPTRLIGRDAERGAIRRLLVDE